MKTNSSDSDGFTIVEILVSIAVAGVVIVSLSQVVTTYVHLAQRGRYLNLANSFVEAKIESLRNRGFNSLTPGTTNLLSELTVQLPPARSASMIVGNPSGGLKRVDITVSFPDQGQMRTYSYTTYIGEIGVGQ